jgi:ATP-binding cassette subfamily C protein CydCD
MHVEPRLCTFTEGVRLRIVGAVLIGLAAVGLGVARLGLLGWLIGEVFAGHDLRSLALPIALIGLVMVLRGAFEHWRAMVAHETASTVQKKLRRTIYDKIATLGPGTIGRQRSGALSLSLIDGVEQLEVYFGQFLPQFRISLLTPVLISWRSPSSTSRWRQHALSALVALFAPAPGTLRHRQFAEAAGPYAPSRRVPGSDPGTCDAEGVRPEQGARRPAGDQGA